MFSRIHPRESTKEKVAVELDHHDVRPSNLFTVWKRSSMSFQGTDGFTVFDHHGKLAFRVDNYSRKKDGGALILMDGAGNALLTLKPQAALSMQCQWSAYRGDGGGKRGRMAKIFSMRSSGSPLFQGSKDEAEVFMHIPSSPTGIIGQGHKKCGRTPAPDFRIQGCFRKRNCKIMDGTGQVVAKIARKRVNKTVMLGDDVFSLVVQHGSDTDVIMAFVIVLDRICVKPFTPIMCN